MIPGSDLASADAAGAAPPPSHGTVGPWRLGALLRDGKWSRVYRAYPAEGPGRQPGDYALKLPKRSGRDGPLAIQWIRREAHVGCRVSHRHLACVLSARVDGPPYYVVTPYLEGASLHAILRAGLSAPLPHVLWVFRQAGEALAALHGAGWLHGDVNPGNVIISSGGHATLIDLGFARRLDSAETAAGGPLWGGPYYAAPEMLSPALRVSAASDIYSLGVALYRTLAGRLPFPDEDRAELVAAHLRRPPPDPRARVPHLPGRVARLLRRMLAKEPVRRPTATELVDRLVDLEIDAFAERPFGG